MAKVHKGYYAGNDTRRKQEAEDASMMPLDTTSFANMPQQIIMKEYKRPDDYFDDAMDDTIQGIDQDHMEAYHQAKKGLKPRKA